MKKYVPAYPVEAPKLFKLILFNYLMSNGDAHYKNFSIIETSFGDFKLSPAYDLLNSRMHIDDRDFALSEGLLPPKYTKGKIKSQFIKLAQMADIPQKQIDKIIDDIRSHKDQVKDMIQRSYLSDGFKRNYQQAYLTRLHKLLRG
jgi:serine/threonine-protein kinase HipA